jgi:hypothetical protein
MNAIQAELDRMVATADGRGLLLWLSQNEGDLDVRIAAANALMRWNPDSAARALETIVRDAGGVVARAMTMTGALSAPRGHAQTAALSLLNVDRQPVAAARASTLPRAASGPVPSALLDTVERVYALAMSGGIEHAFSVARGDFTQACLGLEAIGVPQAARALRDAERLIRRGPTINDPQTIEQELASLDSVLDSIAVMALLEDASEE